MDYLFPTVTHLGWTMATISFVLYTITFCFLQSKIVTEGLLPSLVPVWKSLFRFIQLLCSLMCSVLGMFIMYYVGGKANTEKPPLSVHVIFFFVYLSLLTCFMIWAIKRDRKKKARVRTLESAVHAD